MTHLSAQIRTMPINPKSPYTVTKATGALYCQNFTEIYDLPTVAYATSMLTMSDLQFPILSSYSQIHKRHHERRITSYYGDETQSRDFTYVKKVVKANIQAAKSSKTRSFQYSMQQTMDPKSTSQIIKSSLRKKNRPYIY